MIPDAEWAPSIYVTCGFDGERVEMRSLHRSRTQVSPPGPFDLESPFPSIPTAVLRDAAGRTLSWEMLEQGLVHYYGNGTVGSTESWAALSGDWHAELRDHPDAASLAIVHAGRTLWEIHRPPYRLTIRDVRATWVAAADLLDHPHAHASSYTPDRAMLQVRWTDDHAGTYYERELRCEETWGGGAIVGEPRGELVTAIGGFPHELTVRVRLSDGFHDVVSAPVVVPVPEGQVVAPRRGGRAP